MLTKKKVLPVVRNTGSLTVAAKTADEEVFVKSLCACVGALLAGNMAYNDAQLEREESYQPEELLERAAWFDERMVQIVEDRREIGRFEAKIEKEQA